MPKDATYKAEFISDARPAEIDRRIDAILEPGSNPRPWSEQFLEMLRASRGKYKHLQDLVFVARKIDEHPHGFTIAFHLGSRTWEAKLDGLELLGSREPAALFCIVLESLKEDAEIANLVL